MVKLVGVLCIFVFSASAHAFILVDPDYRLANPEKTEVNIASGACRANGMSDSELSGAIEEAMNRYWNTVTESRLKLKLGGEVSRTATSGAAASGEILVGCQPLGTSGASGVTYPNTANGSAVIILNGSTFVPGGYYHAGLIGVLSHEMGHALGLSHSGDAASVMTYESHAWGPAANHLAQDDKDGVVYLYPNKEFALGLLGSCSAIAGSNEFGARGRPSPWAYFFELGLLLFSGYLAQASLRAVRVCSRVRNRRSS